MKASTDLKIEHIGQSKRDLDWNVELSDPQGV